MIRTHNNRIWLTLAVTASVLFGCAGLPTPQLPSPVPVQTAQPAFTAAPTAAAPAATLQPPAPTQVALPTQTSTAAAVATPPAARAVATGAVSPLATPVQEPSMPAQIFIPAAPTLTTISRCPMPQNLQTGQHSATWTSTVDSGLLCLFGFGDNETVRYQVLDAGGEVAATGEGTQDNLDGDALPSVKVMIAIGNRAPGKWMVKAAAPSGDFSQAFDVQAKTRDGKPAVVLALAGGESQFRLGQSIGIAGYGLPDSAAPLLGVYSVLDSSSKESNLRLHETTVLEPDSGAAFVTLTLDSGYEPGEYCLVLQAFPDYEPTVAPSTLGATLCFAVTK